MERKKPKFKRQEYFRYKRLKGGWRKPKGKHNKMRNYLGGMLSPAIGWRKAETRGCILPMPRGRHNPRAGDVKAERS